LRRRIGRLAVAGLLLAVVSLAWISAVQAVPASQRPYVGGTTNNSEFTLTFSYNGFGRVAGEYGAPGHASFTAHPIPRQGGTGATGTTSSTGGVTGTTSVSRSGATAGSASAATGVRSGSTGITTYSQTESGSNTLPVATGTTSTGPHRVIDPYTAAVAGPLRLLVAGYGNQAAWLLPFAAFGLLALILLLYREKRRGNPRIALLCVLGGWFVVEVLVLSFGAGIVEPYYTSALGPDTAVVVGAGACAFVALGRRDRRYAVLPALALLTTLAIQLRLLHRDYNYVEWLWPLLVVAVIICCAVLWLRPRWSTLAVTAGLAAMLIVPLAYSATVWQVPVDGTFPAAGPYTDSGLGGIGATTDDLHIYATLIRFLDSHHATHRWQVLTQAAVSAAPLILLGENAASIGGYSTRIPVVTPRQLAVLVRRSEARYVLLGGAYSSRGGNAASHAVALKCRFVPPHLWRPIAIVGTGKNRREFYPIGGLSYTLFDCAGRAAALAAS
jgi:4-amino-4-deoxy-L-arabinose transferase-like glycosyltransferase